MRILDVRNNENLMHAKDKPRLEFLPGGFTARAMQQFQTSSDAITCLYLAIFPILREVVR